MQEQNQSQQKGSKKGHPKDFDERVIEIKRVSKVVKGGRKMSFNALVVVGDKQGKVGLGLGKANEVKEAVRKGSEKARKNMKKLCLIRDTIPFECTFKFKSAEIFLKPAGEGTGLIAGGAIRFVLELFGVKNILTKQLGSNNPINNAYATYGALEQLSLQHDLFQKRSKNISQKA